MICRGLGDEPLFRLGGEAQVEPRRRIEPERRARRAGETGHDGRAVGLPREVDPDPSGRRKPRVDGQPEQALFAGGRHLRVQVEHGAGLQHAVDHEPDAARLLHHELPMVVAGIGDQAHWLIETREVRRHAQRLGLDRGAPEHRDQNGFDDAASHGGHLDEAALGPGGGGAARLTRRMTGFCSDSGGPATPGAVKRRIWLLAM